MCLTLLSRLWDEEQWARDLGTPRVNPGLGMPWEHVTSRIPGISHSWAVPECRFLSAGSYVLMGLKLGDGTVQVINNATSSCQDDCFILVVALGMLFPLAFDLVVVAGAADSLGPRPGSPRLLESTPWLGLLPLAASRRLSGGAMSELPSLPAFDTMMLVMDVTKTRNKFVYIYTY